MASLKIEVTETAEGWNLQPVRVALCAEEIAFLQDAAADAARWAREARDMMEDFGQQYADQWHALHWQHCAAENARQAREALTGV